MCRFGGCLRDRCSGPTGLGDCHAVDHDLPARWAELGLLRDPGGGIVSMIFGTVFGSAAQIGLGPPGWSPSCRADRPPTGPTPVKHPRRRPKRPARSPAPRPVRSKRRGRSRSCLTRTRRGREAGRRWVADVDVAVPRAAPLASGLRPALKSSARRASCAWAHPSGLAEPADCPGSKPVDAVAGSPAGNTPRRTRSTRANVGRWSSPSTP